MSSNIFGYSGASVGGSNTADLLKNYVTLATGQIITGKKTFTSPIFAENGSSGMQMILTASAAVGFENPIVEERDAVISSHTLDTEDPAVLVLTVNNQTNSGIKITPTSVILGGGGTNAVPTSFLEVTSAGTARCVGSVPSSTDSSTRIATTAWAQNAIRLSVPSGTISMYSGEIAPTGYVLCNGSLYSQENSLYRPLFDVIGYIYTISPIFPNFAVPDLRGIFPSMPGTRGHNIYPGVVIEGPSGLGSHQMQSTVFVDHQHTTNYPQSSLGVLREPSSQYRAYESGSSGQTSASSTGNNIVAPAYTVVNNQIRPYTLGINYIIKL